MSLNKKKLKASDHKNEENIAKAVKIGGFLLVGGVVCFKKLIKLPVRLLKIFKRI